jgi:chromosome segregation ATPase
VFQDALREAQSQNKDLSRQVQELLTIRVQLEADRDRLSSELNDANEALRDLQLRFETANSSLNQLRIDFEHRLREKDEEIENVRSASIIRNKLFSIATRSPLVIIIAR